MSSAASTNHGIVTNNSLQEVLAAAPLPPQLAQQIESQDGSRAIEVAAMFDGAVQEVRHFDSPSAGRLSTLTKGLLSSAGIALIGTFGLFAGSVSQVATEKAAESAASTPAQRTKESGHGRDGAAGGLLFYGLGALLYGLHRAGSERKENDFSIGSAPNATFQIDSSELPVARFPLVRSNGTDYEFLFTDTMSGHLVVSGQTRQLGELRSEAQPAQGVVGAFALTIPDGARLAIEHQGCSFLIRSVPRARRYPVPMQIDWRAQSYTGAVLAGAAVLLGVMFSAPPDPRSLALDNFTNEQLMRYMVKAPEVKEETPEWLKQVEKKKEEASPPNAPRNRTRTELSRPIAFRTPTPTKAMTKAMTKEVATKEAREMASHSGLLQILNSGSVPSLLALTASGSALGDAAQQAIAGVEGIDSSDGYGTPNGNLVGTGPGGNPGDNTIGGGPLGTGHRPLGYGNRPGTGLGPYRAKTPPEFKLGIGEVSPGMDKEVIRRVIRGHMNEVKFCYERELTRDSSLTGRLVVKFAINNMGNVASSFIEASTLRNPSAEQCISSAVRRWQFPKPQGGLVMVSYPFVLKSASE